MADKIAGIDVHKKVLMVVVMDARTPESKPERRRFTTMPGELRRVSTWLKDLGVEETVMESTAQYWRSVWLALKGTEWAQAQVDTIRLKLFKVGALVRISAQRVWLELNSTYPWKSIYVKAFNALRC